MFEKFITILRNKYGDLNESEIEFLRRKTKFRTYRKNEIFFLEGNYQRNAYFVLEGYVRLFYNLHGKDKTGFFFEKGCFIWPGENNKLINRNYSCVEDTILVLINKDSIAELIDNSTNFAFIYRSSREEELIKYQNLISNFITLSPEERFKNLIKKNGSIFLNVPQQYIASYIGISSESFSRIKKRVYKNYI